MARIATLQKKESDTMKCFPSMTKFALCVLALTLAAGVFMISGCGDDTLSSSSTSLLQYITSTPAGEIQKGSTSIVEVKVTNGQGEARSGKRVTFTVTPSSLGYFTPVSDTSDADGTVASVFTATSAGTATLQATVGSVSKTASLTISDASSNSGRVAIQMSQQLLTANGSDSAEVAIAAVDLAGNAVPNGTTVLLVAGERFQDRDHNGYWTTNVDSLIFDTNANGMWDPIGSIPSSVTTSDGAATAIYRAGSQATSVYIRATVILDGDVQYAEVSAKLNPNTTVASISLTHHFEDLRVRGVGGIEWSVVSATAYDEFGNTVPEGIPIDFTIASGPGGGENIESKGYGPVTVSTNSNGQATVTVYSGTVSGTIRVRASSASVMSAATHLVVNAGPPYRITVGIANCNLRSFDFVNVENKVVAVVCDVYTNPVPDSTVVYFSTSEGCVEAYGLTGVAHPKGVTSVFWKSCSPYNGRVRVRAETAGGTVRDSVGFISSGPVAYIRVLQYPSSLVANAEDKGKVLIEVTDINDNFVVNGTNVAFEAKFGVINGGGTSDGCYFSLYETNYNANTLKKDYSPVSPDDGIGAYSTVSVKAGGAGGISTGFTTLFLTTNTYTKSCEINIETEVEPNSTVPFSITVKDRSGNPLGGHTLSIRASLGTVSTSQLVTDEYGEVNLFYTASAAEGACVITVTDLDPRGGVSFAKKIKVKIADI